MDGYTQQIYEHLKRKHPNIGEEILRRTAKNIAEKHRSEGHYTARPGGWAEGAIKWAKTGEPVRRQREMFSRWADYRWTTKRAAQQYIKLNPDIYDENDISDLMQVLDKTRWEHEPPKFRYRAI